jgi:phosphotransferase system enzyme I (PtsI)
MTKLTGRGVSAGTAIGRAVIAVRDARQVRYRLAASGVDRERQRLKSARARARVELEEISARVARTAGPAQAAIFAAQLLMLDDPLLASRADEFIRTERINADWALERAIAELHEIFAREGASWLQERAGDLADVAGRLQRNLRPGWDPLVDLVHELEPPLIVVADDLPPSVAAQLDWTRVRGLVCDAGSPTHHTVILARSLGVPAVVGLGRATRVIAPGQSLAIDGETGEVLLDPSDEVLDRWRRRAATAEVALRALDELRGQPAVTADGVRIRLEANLEIAEEVGRVRDSGAEGIGLYRSEFLLDAAHPDSSTEEAQIHTYRQLLEAMRPMPVTIRTFDAGDERGEMGDHRERFGLRGIRAGLHHDPRFVVQIRALLRAASAGNLRILLPFVTSGEELRRARGLIEDIAQSIGMTVTVPIGAMIEVPAAALMARTIASHCDFLSIGTNDLTQYTLAADRQNPGIAGTVAYHPAVVRLIARTIAAAHSAGILVDVCGEAAGDPELLPLLVALGVDELSVSPARIAQTRRYVRSLSTQRAKAALVDALAARTPEGVAEAARGALDDALLERLEESGDDVESV